MDIFLYTLGAELAPPSVVKYSTERFIIQYIIRRWRECEEAWLEEISHWGRCCLVLCSSSSIVSLTLVLRNVKSLLCHALPSLIFSPVSGLPQLSTWGMHSHVTPEGAWGVLSAVPPGNMFSFSELERIKTMLNYNKSRLKFSESLSDLLHTLLFPLLRKYRWLNQKFKVSPQVE